MTDVSAGFRPPCWCPSRWAPAWRLHTNLYKFEKNVSPHIFHKKNYCDLNLGESLCISTFFLFPDSRLRRLNGFYFLFWSILNGVTLKTSNSVSHRITQLLCCFKHTDFPKPRKIFLLLYRQHKGRDQSFIIDKCTLKSVINVFAKSIYIQFLKLIRWYSPIKEIWSLDSE